MTLAHLADLESQLKTAKTKEKEMRLAVELMESEEKNRKIEVMINDERRS